MDLNTMLSGPDQSDWALTRANAINDAGQVAGLGQRRGSSNLVGLLLTPAN